MESKIGGDTPIENSPEARFLFRGSTIDPAYEDIGYESGGYTGEEVNGPEAYTLREMEALTKFAQLHEQIDIVSEHQDQGLGWYNNKVEGQPVKKENLVFAMDARLIHTMHWIALHMYEQFAESAHMAEAAHFMIEARKAEKAAAKQFEIDELNNMMDVP